MKKLIFNWAPPLIWMGIIFYFSSLQRVEVSEKDLLNFLFFKTLHIVEYGVLFFLFFRSFFKSKITYKQACIYAIILSVSYGALDEIHQTFVPTRQGSIKDVFIDALGVLLMFFIIKNNLSFFKRRL